MRLDSPPWRHWADIMTPPGFLGMAEVTLTSGGSVVGDVWRREGGWLEVLPVGLPPSVIAWLPVAGIRMLSEKERSEVVVRHHGGTRARRRPSTAAGRIPIADYGSQEVLALRC